MLLGVARRGGPRGHGAGRGHQDLLRPRVAPQRLASLGGGAAVLPRQPPAGQPFLPISGCAVAFLPSLAKLLRDEMEYVLLLRLCEGFLPDEAARSRQARPAARGARSRRRASRGSRTVVARRRQPRARRGQRWFDLAAIDALATYDVEMSAAPATPTSSATSNRSSSSATASPAACATWPSRRPCSPRAPARSCCAPTTLGLNLRELDALYTNAFFRVSQLLDERKAVAEKLRGDWQKAKLEVQAKQARLKALVGERGRHLKRGSETEAQVKELFRSIVVPRAAGALPRARRSRRRWPETIRSSCGCARATSACTA